VLLYGGDELPRSYFLLLFRSICFLGQSGLTCFLPWSVPICARRYLRERRQFGAPWRPHFITTLSKASITVKCCPLSPLFRRYLRERRQFGAPLASFQLMQEKLARMLGNVNVSGE
jgi:hypothetical protein